MKIIKEELEFEECLKQRLEVICEFAKVKPVFINGSIRKLDVAPLGYKHEDKRLVIDYSTKDVVVRIFDLYYNGYSYQKISNLFNEEKVLGKDNWRDSTIVTILENEIYKGDFVHGKRTRNPRNNEFY